MCGISGHIHKSSEKLDRSIIQKMNHLIIHRGPDGEGYYYQDQIAFGHRRLAIIDLSNDGAQPMHYQDQLVITYNGEIYNYLELKDELLSHGYNFNSKSDTEVILAAYMHWGENCVNRFNGMWSFAIHDKQKNIIFCSRDRFGVKPFYYLDTNQAFYFGSEIKQLLLHKKELNENVLKSFLFNGAVEYTDETFFKDVFKLKASHNLVLDLSTMTKKIYPYYFLNDSNSNANTEQILDSAISLRLRSDVKVGTCLSGGIDSTTIAFKAAATYNKLSSSKFQAIHAKSIEPQGDESNLAIMAAKKSDIDLSIIAPDPQTFFKNIEEVVYTQEEPFDGPSIFLQYFVMKEAKSLECKVMLDGQGGDETFLGYERYYYSALYNFLKNYGVLFCLNEIREAKKNNINVSMWKLFKFLIGRFFWKSRILNRKLKNKYIKPRFMKMQFDDFKMIADASSSIAEFQKLEIFKTNLPALLRYEDKNSMRHSIETRLPFLDFRMVEHCLRLPLTQKIQGGWTKKALRSINASLLGQDIAWNRRKLGFSAPEKTWLYQNQEKLVSYIEGSSLLKKYCHQERIIQDFNKMSLAEIWRYINIAVWEKVYEL